MNIPERILKYGMIVLILFSTLLLTNILILYQFVVKDSFGSLPIETIAACVTSDPPALKQDGLNLIDQYHGFAMLMNEEGQIVWSYQKPEELPDQYSMQDVLKFSRWYLDDYPVTCYTVADLILVVGTPKDSIWKINVVSSETTIRRIWDNLPWILAFNFFILFFVPFLYVRWDMHQKEQRRTTWIAGISHDIRTPLTLVLGYNKEIQNILTEKTLLDEELRQKTENVELYALRIREIVSNLNMESKLTFGTGNWSQEAVQLSALLREVLCNAMNRSDTQHISFACDIDPSLESVRVKGNRDMLRRMLENLINNIIVHNPQGCRAECRLLPISAMAELSFQERIHTFRHHYVLIIQDDGVGVSKEVLQRLHRPVSNDQLGEHGIGTRLVRLIARRHGWYITFQNQPDHGLICRIYI